MSTTQRHDAPDLIRALCHEPGRFSFVQAVELLLSWLSDCHQVPRRQALDRLLRFGNCVDLAFPTGDLGAVSIDSEKDAEPHAVLTALFMGFTGVHGALPHHYTARLAADRDGGTRALLDVFSTRFVRHFYVASRKHRVHLPSLDQAADDLQPLLAALSGNAAGTPVEDTLAAYYTGAFQQRPVSAAMLQSVLNDYFRLPITVEPSIGYWHSLGDRQLNQLGGDNCKLDGRFVLGKRIWRREGRIRIRVGPLHKSAYNNFLPDGANVPRLRALLSMFHMPAIDFEIVLVLAAADVKPIVLGSGFRLGYDTFMVTAPGIQARHIRYLLTLSEGAFR